VYLQPRTSRLRRRRINRRAAAIPRVVQRCYWLRSLYTTLEGICLTLAIVSPALLLAARLISRSRFPWWLILLVTAIVSTTLGVALDNLGRYAHNEQTEACFEVMAQGETEQFCSVSYDVWTIPWYLKWLSGAVLLVACLPFYGLAVLFRKIRAT
jgi:hypothetical protein